MVVTIDADLQDPPETIGSMIEEIEAGADIVHAQRRRREGETWGKLAAARLFYRLMRCFSGTPIIPNCGDFRALTRPVVEVLISFRALHLFHRGRVAQLGFRQSVISYDRDRRHAGKTKYPFLKMVNLAIDAILGFSAIPIRVISWTSIILWSISLIYVGKALIERFVFHVTVPGWTSIVILQFFFTGLILFCTAIVGSYVGRLFLQSQQPLLYWLRDTKNFDPSFVDHRGRSVREVELSRRAVTRNRRQTADPFPRAPPT
jgi:dolichol-phosphate mannosyltransferase